jgi:hypothetical protein
LSFSKSVPEISEEKRRQSMLNNFNDKVYDFFELNTEFQSIESRISGEKRPKMDEIKTMEAYMNQQKDRKNFIDYEDLKLLEQHLSGDKIKMPGFKRGLILSK